MTSAAASSSTLKTENTESSGKLVSPLNENLRNFVSEGRNRQTNYASLEGSLDRCFRKNDIETLRQFINLMLFYQEDDNLNVKKLTSEQERHVKQMAKEIMQYSCKDEVYCQVIWIYFYNHEKGETNCTPLFKVSRTTGDAYIDNNLKHYKSWDAYWNSAVFPPSVACVPRNGTYSFCRETGELDLVFLSPNVSRGKPKAKSIVSQPFFWGALRPWIGNEENQNEMIKKMLEILPVSTFANSFEVVNRRVRAFVFVLNLKLVKIMDTLYDCTGKALVTTHSFLLLGCPKAGQWIHNIRPFPKSLPKLLTIFFQELLLIATPVLGELGKYMCSTQGDFLDRIPARLSLICSNFFPEKMWAALLLKGIFTAICEVVKHLQKTGQEVVSSCPSDGSSCKDIIEQLKKRVPQEMMNICSRVEDSKEAVLLGREDDSSEEAIYLFRNSSLSQLSVELKKVVGDAFKIEFVSETHFNIINSSDSTVGQLYSCGDRFVVGSISRGHSNHIDLISPHSSGEIERERLFLDSGGLQSVNGDMALLGIYLKAKSMGVALKNFVMSSLFD